VLVLVAGVQVEYVWTAYRHVAPHDLLEKLVERALAVSAARVEEEERYHERRPLEELGEHAEHVFELLLVPIAQVADPIVWVVLAFETTAAHAVLASALAAAEDTSR